MTLDAYRRDDRTAVDDAAAREAWTRAARPVLVQVARRYGSLMKPGDLAEEVQGVTSVRTRVPAEEWIDDVLDAVDVDCVARDEPLLSSFCVGADGRIGDRYRRLVSGLDPTATDVEMHAATQRLEAHRYHGAIMPVDGGKPALPPQLAKLRASAPKSTATRTRATRAKAPAPRRPKKPDLAERPVCPTCFLQLPATGRCDNCDE
ncbi:MAG TPA: hypothetical protein VFX21_11345 [Acidimicrobiia bacterium]|nr:hypothetical protein [Acidimicrobiia bacterium]